MKIRLLQDGFSAYNGQMGVLNFTNGLSDGDVKVVDAVRMASVMVCVWEDGTSPSITQSLLDNANTAAPIILAGEAEHDAEAKLNGTLPVAPQARVALAAYSEAALEAIADKDGIKGLRVISDPLGVRGNSIKDLIRDILFASKA